MSGIIEELKIKTQVVIEVTKEDSTIEKRVVENIITNNGLNMIANRASGLSSMTTAVSKIAIGNNDTAAAKTDTALKGTKLAELASTNTVSNNVITYVSNFTQAAAYEVKEAGLFNASNVLFARTTFPVVNKGVNDTLKVTWKWTIQ